MLKKIAVLFLVGFVLFSGCLQESKLGAPTPTVSAQPYNYVASPTPTQQATTQASVAASPTKAASPTTVTANNKLKVSLPDYSSSEYFKATVTNNAGAKVKITAATVDGSGSLVVKKNIDAGASDMIIVTKPNNCGAQAVAFEIDLKLTYDVTGGSSGVSETHVIKGYCG
ncbi:MAG: hypothetical protein V1834_00190 [Candidatus Micrarchaeota archaeon]